MNTRCNSLQFGFSLTLMVAVISNSANAEPDNFLDVRRGQALVTAGDCIACHTAPGGKPFAGGLAMETPFGTIMTPNITPDDTTGIGRWTSDNFARALHDGRRPDGGYLYPAFPYPFYTRVSRQDTDAILAYLKSLAPVSNSVNRNTLPFPFNIRLVMAVWNGLFFRPGRFNADPAKSVEFNRGAYLVEGLGHCGACHTPMNSFGANKADLALQGNQITDWTAPNITNDARSGLGKWSVDNIVQYLATGRTETSIATGPMKEVIENSTSIMPKDDLKAIAVYLKERGATGAPAPQPLPKSDPSMKIGEAIFVDACAACHTREGSGIKNIFPQLAGNAVVNQDNPTTLIRVVLSGAKGAGTPQAPTSPAMPSFGYRLSDEQVAAVVTYVRNSWNNTAPVVTAEMVRQLRGRVAQQAAP